MIKKITFLLLTLTFAFSVKGQQSRGKINSDGYFQFNSYATMLEYLDYIKQHEIDGDWYFYFTITDAKTKKKSTIVMPLYNEYTQNDIKKFSNLKNGIVVQNSMRLAEYMVNETEYAKISKLSRHDFYKKYVSKKGLIDDRMGQVVMMAVIYRILKDNIPINKNEVSGEWVLMKQPISW